MKVYSRNCFIKHSNLTYLTLGSTSKLYNMSNSQKPTMKEKVSVLCHHKNPFINKLFDLVEVQIIQMPHLIIINQNNREPEVVTWSPNGTSFIVYNREVFSTRILPTLFSHKNLSSFTRQVKYCYLCLFAYRDLVEYV